MDPIYTLEIAGVCYQTGQSVVDIYNTWRSDDHNVRDRVIEVESTWKQLRQQTKILERIAPIIPEHLFAVLNNLLYSLHQKLLVALSNIDCVKKKEVSRRYSSITSITSSSWSSNPTSDLRKDAVDTTIRDVKSWQRKFNPTWFTVLRIDDSRIDRALGSETNVPSSINESHQRVTSDVARDLLALAKDVRATLTPGFSSSSIYVAETTLELRDIQYSAANYCRLSSNPDTKWYIVDHIACRPGQNVGAVTRDIGRLAAKLSNADPIEFGMLSCKGAMRVTHQQGSSLQGMVSAIRMIFRIPTGMDKLQSLRDLLITTPSGIALNRRYRIARELAKSVSYTYTFDFAHKNIRPESILCFENSALEQTNTFLVGFDAFRTSSDSTDLFGDHEWARNIYRHPQRQGVLQSERYRMEHDIYSLGVVLLELGLWDSFIAYSVDDHHKLATQGSWYNGSNGFLEWMQEHKPTLMEWPWKLKEFFVEMATTALPILMGDRYTEVVVRCLTFLDEHDDPLSGGMRVAVEFLESILFPLSEISV